MSLGTPNRISSRPAASNLASGGITYGGGNVNGHDPAQKPDGTPLTRGYISLQSESHPIQFRRVELLDLEACAESCR